MKQQSKMDLTMPNGACYLDFSEFRTLLVKCADLINSHPIEVTLIDEDLQPLTPNHLLIGRAQSGQVSKEVLIEGDDKYTKRTRYVSELSSQGGKPGSVDAFPPCSRLEDG